jgi:hypothetical protein
MTARPAGLGIIPDNPTQLSSCLSNLPADIAAVRALLQAAVNVELFTIPLYMCAMKSIQGTHAINAEGVSYYKGRVWPGRSIGKIPENDPNKTEQENRIEIANQTAYNVLFSVFIDEMLHLQMASNLCVTLGVKPDFNSPALQDKAYNWTCYGQGKTVIPHIVDLKDLKETTVHSVELRDLTPEQLALFIIIEQNDERARSNLKSENYFPTVPFSNWTAQSTETDLPMFGTIGWMYYCLLQYTTMKYEDGQTLWQKMFAGQRDLFNAARAKSTHPDAEYPLMPVKIGVTAAVPAHIEALKMIFGICDQGEGTITAATINAYAEMIEKSAPPHGLRLVESDVVLQQFQPDVAALQADYPSYDADGHKRADSDDAIARGENGKQDHFRRFIDLQGSMHDIQTWRQWHADPSSKWSASMLTTAGYVPPNQAIIPAPEAVATALNNLKSTDATVLDNVVQGALAGITKVLTASWSDQTVAFPFPSMVGSGDRMALFWAVFGQAPTLQGVSAAASANVATGTLYHACQSLSLDGTSGGECAAPRTYHSCKGSNGCATQGGCGFIQPVTGGGNCSQAGVHGSFKASNDKSILYSAPADNRCAGFGGCAVPISASQLFPNSDFPSMQFYAFKDGEPVKLKEQVVIKQGDSVYETAWQAVEAARAFSIPGYKKQDTPPQPTDLRLALPPST